MRTLEEAIKHAEYIVNNRKDAISVCWSMKDCKQLAAWLRELQERMAEPEIVTCYECKHYSPVSRTSNSWGKCSVHSSPTEKQRTCQSCDYCSWSERRTDGQR